VRLTADVTEPDRVGDRWPLEVLEVDGERYLDAWRAWAAPQRAGQRILLQPAWRAPTETTPDDLVLLVDPGHAFGSGSHPSTRLVLAALETIVTGGERVLDVGCGSGVLAIAACRLGAASALGIDIDPAAVEATRANAERNGVADRVLASTDDLHDIEGTFDVVVANIGARVLRELATEIIAHVRPGGSLVLAGLLDTQVDEVVAAYAGCVETERRTEDGWVGCVFACSGRRFAPASA
jgi:ribosomal protein L11 methyltransferase